MYFIFWYKV